MRGIIWLRRDLRVHDQPALTAAFQECEEVLPHFVVDDPLLRSQEFGSACVNFMLGCLQELSASLAGLGLALQWRLGEPVEAVVRVARESKADVVYWNRDYEPVAIERDRRVQLALAELGIRTRTFKDHVVFEAEEIRGATGDPLQRYSAYRARWWAKWQSSKPSPLASPKPKASTPVPPRPAPPALPSPGGTPSPPPPPRRARLAAQRSAGQVPRLAPVAHGMDAVDEDVLDPGRELPRDFVCRAVDYCIGIEDGDVSERPRADLATVHDAQTPGRQRRHLADRLRQRHQLLVPDVVSENLRIRAVRPRVRLAAHQGIGAVHQPRLHQ